MEFAFQKTFSAAEVKIIRKKLKLKQRELAELMNVSVKTVERWECGNGEVKGSAAVLLAILREKVWLVEEFEIQEKKLPVRLWYMYNDQLCTIIDVDDPARNVKIKNFAADPVLRAFGKEEHPSYEDYEAFPVQSSKGNQLKWEQAGEFIPYETEEIFYKKADIRAVKAGIFFPGDGSSSH